MLPLISQLQRHRVLISRVVAAALLLYLFVFQQIGLPPFDATASLIGYVFIILGLAIRSLSAGVLQKNQILACEGIYAIVRNPLYLGSLLLLIGLNLLIYNLLLATVSALLFVSIYLPTILNEERGLAHRHGESWLVFKRSTPRILPNLLRVGELRTINWSYHQWLKNHEHNTVFATLAILLALTLYT